MLMKDFSAQLNEDFYQKSLKHIEAIVEQHGSKTFQSRISLLLKSESFTYMQDDVVDRYLQSNEVK